jgi:hypothetical protein
MWIDKALSSLDSQRLRRMAGRCSMTPGVAMYRHVGTAIAVLAFVTLSAQQAAATEWSDTVAYYSGIGHAGAGEARALRVGRVLTVDGSYDGPWPSGVSCTPSAAATNFAGQDVNRLAGWSLGRLGPIYALNYLRTHDQLEARTINYIIMYDPGSPDDFSGSCDTDPRVAASATLTWWLGMPDTDHRLVVIAGQLTQTSDYQSIRQTYFPAIVAAGPRVRHRVLVCGYDLDHDASYSRYAALMVAHRLPTTPTACPRQGTQPVLGWNP